MAILEVANLSHSFGEKTLYKNVEFELFKGEHMGIVGQNGAGKSTLLRSLTGQITPDSGEIRWQKNILVGYLDQYAKIDQNATILEYLKTAFSELYRIEKELNSIYEKMATASDELLEKASNYQGQLTDSGFYELESTILKVAAGLGVSSLGMESQVKNLSGGQRARVILAKLLLQSPEVLLLDEPTNFLDKEHVNWLAEFLKGFKGEFMLISHDYDFICQVVNCVLDIEFQTVSKYSVGFEKFLELKELKKEGYIRQFKAQQKEIKKHEEYIAKNRVKTSTARQAQSRIKKLEKIQRLAPPKTTGKPSFTLNSLPVSRQKALKVNHLKIGYTHPLLPELSFEVKPGEKIVIVGFNGIGKSTLMKTLMGQIPPLAGSFKFADHVKLAYFQQGLSWEAPEQTPLEIMQLRFPQLSNKEARSKLAQCKVVAKNVTQKIQTLSGGEQAKVKLCILAQTPANFLILDEPTNHLDADAKEVLKQQLLSWQGNLILVSHEAAFYNDLADKVIDLNIK